MTQIVEPSPNSKPLSYPFAGAISRAGAVEGWVVPEGEEEYIEYVDPTIDPANLRAFDADHSDASFNVTIYGGEAFVAGKWLATDETFSVTINASDTETVYLAWAAQTADSIIVDTVENLPAHGGALPIWTFTTDAGGVQTAESRRPLGAEAAPGIGVYGRDEAVAEFYPRTEADNEFAQRVGGDTFEGNYSVTGNFSIVGNITTEGDYQLTYDSQSIPVMRAGPYTQEVLNEASIAVGAEEVALHARNTGAGGTSFPSVVLRSGGGIGVFDNTATEIMTIQSGSGGITIPGSSITMPNSDGDEGLQFANGNAFSQFSSWATAYTYSSDGSAGFRVRNPDGPGDVFTAEPTGAVDVPGSFSATSATVSDAPSANNEVARHQEIEDLDTRKVESEDTNQIYVGTSPPENLGHNVLNGDIWVDQSNQW